MSKYLIAILLALNTVGSANDSAYAQEARPTAIRHSGVDWQLEKDAWKAPGWMWVHFTNAPGCGPCVVAERMHKDPDFVRLSRNFNCVLMCWCDPELHPRINAYFDSAKIPV